jgi:hypothetical protein
MRFSLRDLMLVVAFWAGIAWCAAQVGFDNGMFWFSVGVCAVLSALFIRLARYETPRRRGWLATLPVLLFSFCLASIVTLVDAALLTIAGVVVYQRARPSLRSLCSICMASGLIALAAGIIPGLMTMHGLEVESRELPIVSLANRVKYEKPRHLPGHQVRFAISESVSAELNNFEHTLDERADRKRQFERLHRREYVQFVNSIGFGVGRMRAFPTSRDSLRRPPMYDIGFNARDIKSTPSEQGYWRGGFLAQKSNAIEHIHLVRRNDFLDPDGFGVAIEPPLIVTGFVEHGFHYPPTNGMGDATPWTILRLELVSLLKFAEPRVYVLDHLPRMDQLSSDNAPTRPLDAFESESLAKLRTDEDVVVKNDGNEYRMLGSLRAAKQCLDCHGVQRGELLGAFSYSLHHETGPEGNNRDR